MFLTPVSAAGVLTPKHRWAEASTYPDERRILDTSDLPRQGVSTAEKLQQLLLLAGLSEGVASPEYNLGVLPAHGSRDGISPAAVRPL